MTTTMSDDVVNFIPCEQHPPFPLFVRDITVLRLQDGKLLFAFENSASPGTSIGFSFDMERVSNVRNSQRSEETPYFVEWDYKTKSTAAAAASETQTAPYQFIFESYLIAILFAKIMKGELEKIEWSSRRETS